MASEVDQYAIAVNKDKNIHSDIRNCFTNEVSHLMLKSPIYVSSLYKTLTYVCTCLVGTHLKNNNNKRRNRTRERRSRKRDQWPKGL